MCKVSEIVLSSTVRPFYMNLQVIIQFNITTSVVPIRHKSSTKLTSETKYGRAGLQSKVYNWHHQTEDSLQHRAFHFFPPMRFTYSKGVLL